MKSRSFISLFLTTFACMLTACTTPAENGNANTQAAPAASAPPAPAQIAAQVCPPVQTALTGLNELVDLPEGAQKDLKAITPIIDGVCAAGAAVKAGNLQQLAQTALPAIIDIVKTSVLSAEQQNAIIVDVTAAQLILTAFAQTQAQAQANLTTH